MLAIDVTCCALLGTRQVPATAAGIGWSYWEYSQYCDTKPSPACLPGQPCDFGACITGVNGNANANFTCPTTPAPSPTTT
jgi:hypothetical protein